MSYLSHWSRNDVEDEFERCERRLIEFQELGIEHPDVRLMTWSDAEKRQAVTLAVDALGRQLAMMNAEFKSRS